MQFIVTKLEVSIEDILTGPLNGAMKKKKIHTESCLPEENDVTADVVTRCRLLLAYIGSTRAH